MIPGKAVLFAAGQGAAAFLVQIHVDEAVPLAHLAGAQGDGINGRPGGVAHHRHAVQFHRLLHLGDVAAQVVDAVRIVDGAVRLHGIHRAQAVLHDHQRDLVTVIQVVQRIPQPLGVDAPAPGAALQVGVFVAGVDAVQALEDAFGLLAGDVGQVVAVGEEVHLAPQQFFGVPGLFGQRDALAFQLPALVGRVIAAALHVGVEQHLVHKVHGADGIRRFAAVGVGEVAAVHHAHAVFRVDGVGVLHGPGAGQELVVGGGHPHGLILRVDAGRHPGLGGHAVDLVESQPQPDPPLEVSKQRMGVAGVELHHPAVSPGTVLLQAQRGLEVGDGHQRLDAVFQQLVDDRVVESQPLGVGGRLVPVGIDAGPADGHAVAFEAHLGKEGDVLLVMVVEVDGRVAGVVGIGLQHRGDAALDAVPPHRHYIGGAQALTALAVGAFDLVGGSGAAPQKVFGKRHGCCLLLAGRTGGRCWAYFSSSMPSAKDTAKLMTKEIRQAMAARYMLRRPSGPM